MSGSTEGGSRGWQGGGAWYNYMPLMDGMKKRACRFILHHYLGRYLKDRLTLDQLHIDLYNGTGSLHNVPIDLCSVNELLENAGIPVELVAGEIDTITVSIPWSNIFNKPSRVEIKSLSLSLKGQTPASDSMFLSDSFYNGGMSTSMMLAKQVLKEDEESSKDAADTDMHQSQPEALEFFAQAIEAVLLKVKISLVDTKIRFEPNDPWDDSIEVVVKKIDFFDESQPSDPFNEQQSPPSGFTPTAFCTKVFRVQGISLHHIVSNYSSDQEDANLSNISASDSNSEKDTPETECSTLIGNFVGKMEARAKIKQQPTASGPKLELDCFLGSFALFVEPNHVTVLSKLLSGFLKQATDSRKDSTSHEPTMPFTSAEIEQQIQEFNAHADRHLIGGSHMSEDEFYSVYGGQSQTDSMHSSITAPSVASDASTAVSEGWSAFRRKRKFDDDNAPLKIHTRLSGVSLVLMHHNERDFDAVSQRYFQKLHNISSVDGAGFGAKDFVRQLAVIDDACNASHITLLACPINIKCDIYQTRNSRNIENTVTLGFCHLSESVHSVQSTGSTVKSTTTILSFANQQSLQMHEILSQPSVKFDIKFISMSAGGSSRASFTASLQFAPAVLDLDLTILDRLIELFAPQDSRSTPNSFHSPSRAPKKDEMLEDETSKVIDLKFEVLSQNLTINFFIPIPNFDDSQDEFLSRTRSIRPEHFRISFADLVMGVMLSVPTEEMTLSLSTSSLLVSLVCTESIEVQLLSVSNLSGSIPSIQFIVYPFKSPLLVGSGGATDNMHAGFTTSTYDSFPFDIGGMKQEKGPFSSKIIIHDSQPVIKPGSIEEMRCFSEECLSNSRMVLKLCLPLVTVLVPNKAVFDLVYNRFSNDLLLWEPLFSKKLPSNDSPSSGRVGLGLSSQARAVSDLSKHFSMCKSQIRSVYQRESAEYDSDGGEGNADDAVEVYEAQHWMSIQIDLGRAALSLTDFDGEKEEIAFQAIAEVGNGSLFVVAGHEGEQETTFICFNCFDGKLFYSRPGSFFKPLSVSPNGHLTNYPGYMQLLLSRTPKNLVQSPSQEPLVSLSVKIRADRPRNVKDIKVAVGVDNMCMEPGEGTQGVIDRLLDFLSPHDQPVPGYNFLPVLTQLHVSIHSCPLIYTCYNNSSLTLLLNLGSIYMSSNIVAGSASSIFQVISESSSLSIAKSHKAKTVKEFVKIIDTGLLSLTIVLQKQPDKSLKLELRVGCDIINVTACWDSLLALGDLVKGLATSLAPEPPPEELDDDRTSTTTGYSTACSHQCAGHVAASDQMNDLLEEAITEDLGTGLDEPNWGDQEHDSLGQVFLFPDEGDEESQPETKDAALADSMHSSTLSDGRLSPSDSIEGDIDVNMEPTCPEESFCVIEAFPVKKTSNVGECIVRILDDDPLRVIHQHFARPLVGKKSSLTPAKFLPYPITRFHVSELNVSCSLFGGSDFVEPPKRSTHGRDTNTCVEIVLRKIEVLYDMYSCKDVTDQYKSRLALSVDDIEVLDRLKMSSINKMLYCFTAEKMLRQEHASMILFKWLECKPAEENQPGSEFIVRMNVLPIRLNFDQHTVFFISDFASCLSTGTPPNRLDSKLKQGVMGYSKEKGLSVEMPDEDTTRVKLPGKIEKDISKPRSKSDAFIRDFAFISEVLIKFDYQGQFFDLDRGKLVGLIVGLAQIRCSHLKLKQIHAKQGILGFDNLAMYCLTEWLNDIKRNQIPTLLQGIGPMYSLSQIVQGLYDLVWMPVEQYRRDGRILRGIQRGASSFSSSSATAALELTNRMIATIQSAAETAFDLLSPTALPVSSTRRIGAHPGDFREGLNLAYRTLYEGVNDTANTIVREAIEGADTRGIPGAVGGVLRQIPPTLVRPVILASEATSAVLDGVSNQIAPDTRNEAISKWKY